MIIYDYKVMEVMTKNVKGVAKNISIKKVAEIMEAYKIGSVVVMEKNNPIGIVTDTDVVRKVVAKGLNPEKTKVSDIMTKNVITVNPESSIREASILMATNNVRRLPVVGKEGLIGIITETDITKIISNIKQYV
ncbi:MAG: cyclic nucleotide-binding/CBS domain-containing protein [Candidatus Woesearchaeota archaeon]